MAKDRVNYRAARKFSLGSHGAERSIGITTLRTAVKSQADTRPIALMKWSLDDFIIEEQLPGLGVDGEEVLKPLGSAASSLSSLEKGNSTLLVKILSEGVPDPVIEDLLRNRCPQRVSFHFLTPVDFTSCAVRHVWIRGDGRELRRNFNSIQLLHTPAGEVRIYPAFVIRVPPTAPYLPLCLLPDVRYTVVLRDIRGSLNDVLLRLRDLQAKGFTNYGHMARHGLGTLCAYRNAKCLLECDYVGFLQRYVRNLSEGTPSVLREMPSLLDALANPRATRSNWRVVLQGMEAALQHDAEVVRLAQTGLYSPHQDLLKDFVMRAADVAPLHNDSAQVIRESVSRAFLHENMRTASEVHFNALASLRHERFGDRVVVGDIVVPNDEVNSGFRIGSESIGREGATFCNSEVLRASQLRGDIYEGAADHINGSILNPYSHPDWIDLAFCSRRDRGGGSNAGREVDEESELQQWHRRLRVVQSQAEADGYDISKVVLPLFGRQANLLPVLPKNDIGGFFWPLAHELQVGGLTCMKTASVATYRRLAAKPCNMGAYIFDDLRGWDWVEGGCHGEALKARMYRDQDGIYRVASPLMDATQKNMVARSGIRDEMARNSFLKPARKQNITCVVQFTLPRGSPVTSALREVFQFTTLSPSAIFRLLKH